MWSTVNQTRAAWSRKAPPEMYASSWSTPLGYLKHCPCVQEMQNILKKYKGLRVTSPRTSARHVLGGYANDAKLLVVGFN
jgi:hypothetical protein